MPGTGMDKPQRILLSHGGGGHKTEELIRNVFQPYLNDPLLASMDDSAIIDNIVFTTDSFVVHPHFFPGGDIGKLAVSGTVNDITSMGAQPQYLSISFILEEGYKISDLKKILESIREAAHESGVRIVTADTKVVEKKSCDGVFINTSGIGNVVIQPPPSFNLIQPGDAIIINGEIGLHGIAVLLARSEFSMEGNILSDVAPLWSMIEKIKQYNIKFMRDPTRGGLAQTLNEIALSADVGISLDQHELPISPEVQNTCDLLGFDPLEIANEGKMLIICSDQDKQNILDILKSHPLGEKSQIIGTITSHHRKVVTLRTSLGTERIIMPPSGEILPRIC